jgi:hypothetical protein
MFTEIMGGLSVLSGLALLYLRRQMRLTKAMMVFEEL